MAKVKASYNVIGVKEEAFSYNETKVLALNINLPICGATIFDIG